MMTDPQLQERYVRYLDERLEKHALAQERRRTRHDPYFLPVVEFYSERFAPCLCRAGRLRRDALPRLMMEAGHLESSPAARPRLLPHARREPKSRCPLSMAVAHTHRRILGRAAHPSPGAATRPEWHRLAEFGIGFFSSTPTACSMPRRSAEARVHRPARTPGGPAAFARDYESSKQVWAAEERLTGDLLASSTATASFGVDEPHNPQKKLLHAGIKTFTDQVPPHHRQDRLEGTYHPSWARERTAAHAGTSCSTASAKSVAGIVLRPPADHRLARRRELFGHWWFRAAMDRFPAAQIACDQNDIKTITPPNTSIRFRICKPCSRRNARRARAGFTKSG